MKQNCLVVLGSIFFLSSLVSVDAFASFPKAPFEARFFVANHSVKPDEVNTELAGKGLDSFKNISGAGFGIDFALFKPLNLGVRVESRYQKVTETATPSANPNNPYFSALRQQSVEAVARLDLLSNSYAKIDVFGGAGVTNTNLDVRTSAGEGTYQQANGGFISRYGASLGLGLANVLLLVEGGYETNRIETPNRLGTTSGAINNIDLSGTYVAVGLLFNGSPSFVHESSAKK